VARIIIVDDDEVLSELVGETLAAEGHSVSAVHDGEAAPAAIAEATPDAVILDYTLPGCTGLSLLRDLRAAPATRDLPVLMLTARRGRILAGRAAIDGADAFMTKPFEAPALAREIERLLATAQTRRAAGASGTTHASAG
jgi:two-component system, OmpR family, phosphate regulon response regulator PhoB